MPVRTANAVWNGSIAKGKGTMALGSGAYEGPFSVGSRFEQDPGTNPEELIAAAHAGCFSMALSGILTRAGSPPEKIETSAKVSIDQVEGGWEISKIELSTQAVVPGMDEAAFIEHAQSAKAGCPVSKALSAVEITLDASLLG